MLEIFISYRRSDSRKDAGRIYDRLVETFGRTSIFKDVDNIPFGRDFRGVLSEAVNQCDIMLVVIGQQWLNTVDESGNRRLDNPADFVRIEVQSGLQRGDNNCLVIPVLVDSASMPNADKLPVELRELAFKNAVTVRDDPDFHHDMERLVRQLQQYDDVLKALEKAKSAAQNNADNAVQHNANKSSAASSLRPISAYMKSPAGIIISIFIVALALYLLSKVVQLAATAFPTPTNTPTTMAVVPPTDTTLAAVSPTLQPSTSTPSNLPVSNLTAVLTPASGTPTFVLHNADWNPIEKDYKGVPMVQVPAGCFDMGSEQDKDETPVTKICFEKSFWIDKTEVTNAQFAQFKGEAVKPSLWTDANSPRERVTWFEARDFCARRGGRLPTDAEWEYAARGPDDLAYPWGNEFNKNNLVYTDNTDGYPAVVGSKPEGKSWVGALDMSGNVWEWVSTLYKSYPYPKPGSAEERDEWIASTNTTKQRSLRGGSWRTPPVGINLFAAHRGLNTPDFADADGNVGIRCMVSDPIS